MNKEKQKKKKIKEKEEKTKGKTMGRKLQAPPAAAMPTLFCLGNVIGVGDPKLSASGETYWHSIEISGLGASPDTKAMLCYNPEFFSVDFSMANLAALENGRKLEFLYRKQLQHKKRRGKEGDFYLSTLEGLGGSKEGYDTLIGMILEKDHPQPEDVQTALLTFLNKEQPVVGYVLAQDVQKTDAVNPNTGKPVYMARDRYAVAGYYWPIPNQVKFYKNLAESKPDAYKLCYNVDSEGNCVISSENAPF